MRPGRENGKLCGPRLCGASLFSLPRGANSVSALGVVVTAPGTDGYGPYHRHRAFCAEAEQRSRAEQRAGPSAPHPVHECSHHRLTIS
jgi:hypothetical protein